MCIRDRYHTTIEETVAAIVLIRGRCGNTILSIMRFLRRMKCCSLRHKIRNIGIGAELGIAGTIGLVNARCNGNTYIKDERWLSGKTGDVYKRQD